MGNEFWADKSVGETALVIEHSAYMELKAEADKLAEALKKCELYLDSEFGSFKTDVNFGFIRLALTNWQRYLEGKK